MSLKLKRINGVVGGISPAEKHSAENDLPKLQHDAEKSAFAQNTDEAGSATVRRRLVAIERLHCGPKVVRFMPGPIDTVDERASRHVAAFPHLLTCE
jgi:hypothetical protein